jgi:periplasmic protein TonB
LAGEVVVRFVVDAQGAVRRARVVQSSRAEFEGPALRAVERWRFRPGRKAGRAVATWMEVPIAFALPDRRTVFHAD